MFFHYLKIAYRNHSKHKIQSIISLLSLAIAFACVSLAAYWTRYEQTYDSNLSNYNHIYKIAFKRPDGSVTDKEWYMPLPTYLMENYAEVDKACGLYKWWHYTLIEINNHTFSSTCTAITPETVEMFDIQWKEGNQNIKSWNDNYVAISEQLAKEVCGETSPIGQNLILKRLNQKIMGEFTIVAVFKTRPQHSNLRFNILTLLPSNQQDERCETYVQLNPKADVEQFLQKLLVDSVRGVKDRYHQFNVLTPLKEVHQAYPEKRPNVRLDDVKLFTGAAVLFAVCALLNYMTLYVSRLRNRGRDMALRTICGSSAWQTGALLLVEYLLLLFGSLIVSILLIELFFDSFVELSQLEVNRSTVYVNCGYLLLFILGLAMVLSLIPILYFKRRALRVQIEAEVRQSGKRRFHMMAICIQLFISMLFIFCASVMIRQVHHLIHDDIHIERKNIASLNIDRMGSEQIMDVLRQIPSITDMILVDNPLYPCITGSPSAITGFEDKEDMVIHARFVYITQDIANFYGLKMKEGEGNFDLGREECLINETMAKQLGYSNPIGKTFRKGDVVITGVVYDFAYQPPTEPVPALCFRRGSDKSRGVAFKYTGDFATCKAAIEKAFEEQGQNLTIPFFYLRDGETTYNNYLKSEFNLLKLLNIITLISVLIALFGVYALILQECERQRKNIAIRKVYGAQVKDILMMFFKEYLMQVVIAAAFAFPIGYVLMKRWLEGYGRQTSIGIEVFLGIFIGMAFLVMLCIGWHVWRAANENPATAVKKE